MSLSKKSLSLGSFLVGELFTVIKENEPDFADYETPDDLIQDHRKKKSLRFDKKQIKVVRFCALSMELYNCAQRFTQTFSISPERVQVNPYTKLFLSSYFKKKDFDAFIKDFTLEVVFTAHPTEVFPLSVLKNLNRIEMILEKHFTAKAPERQHRYLQALRAHLTSLWLTDEIYRKKPSPEEEADRLFYVFESSLWKATPYFFRKFYWEYNKRYGCSPKHYPNLKFSSWVGGDRDGNPFVTATSTEKIIIKSRRKILRLILLELYSLREETLIKTQQKDLTKMFPDTSFPYKSLFQDLVNKIQQRLTDQEVQDVEDLQSYILKRLRLAYTHLCKDGAKRIANRKLRSLIDRVQSFSLSPLKLDLRQDSEVHSQILKEVRSFSKGKKLEAKEIPFQKLSPLAQDFFQTLKLAQSYSPCPFNCYIISMTRSFKDMENLHELLKLAGTPDLPIVPLFETPDDIRGSQNILAEAQKQNPQLLSQIMWGYSDSTKKGGRLSSAWSLYKAQEESQKAFPNLVHFHGRGGSVARGGGSVENTFRLLPPKVVGTHFRQTFQGEVIQDDFGLPMRTVKSLEEILKESTLNHFKPLQTPQVKVRKKIDLVAETSEKAFQRRFYEDESFSKTFIQQSPISIINEMNLGSRPAKRSSQISGTSYRAIPWVFAWAQTRGALPIWYGLQGLESDLLELKTQSAFVANFLSALSQGLNAINPEIFRKYFPSPDFKKISLDAEKIKHQLSSGAPLQDRRELFVTHLHSVQVELLQRPDSHKDSFEDLKKICTQGIASYLGKSG